MRKSKLITISIFAVIAFLLIAIFLAKNGTTGASAQNKKADVFLVGNPADLPDAARANLPSGYKWITLDDYSKKHNLPLVKDWKIEGMPPPTLIFRINQDGSNIDSVIGWAEENGYDEVYIEYPKVPDGPLVPSAFDSLDNLTDSIIPNALADEPGPACTTGTFYPQGTCWNLNNHLTDDNPGDGQTPSIKLCLADYSAYGCHMEPLFLRSFRNLAGLHYPGSGSHDVISLVGCMKAHNGVNTMYNPVRLTVNFFRTRQTMYSAGFCESPDWACANCPGSGCGTIYATNVDKSIFIAQDKLRDFNWWLIRHEMLHNYGYAHSQYGGKSCDGSGNLNDAKHCCRNHITP